MTTNEIIEMFRHPRTADGAEIVRGMNLYRAVSPALAMMRTVERVDIGDHEAFWAEHGTLCGKQLTKFYGYRFYSTEDAAWKAAEAEAQHGQRHG